MKRKRLRGLIVTLAVVLIVGAMIVFALIPSPLTVEVGRVSRGPLQVTIDQEGETRVHDRFVLSSPVIGRLIRIDLDDGDPIRKGQIVASIDPVPLNQREREEVYARVEAAAAALRLATAREAHAREDREQARRDRERAERLAKEGVISVQALEQARNADVTADDELSAARYGVQVAASEEKVARAGLVSVDTAPGKPRPLIELRSPISGRVLRVVEKSERVVPVGTPILILGEPGQIEVVTDVLSTDAVKIRPGAPVLLDGWGGDHPLRARVRLVEPYGFTKVSALGVEEQRVNVISDFVDPPGPLGDGYRVETHILTWSSENALKMPLSAVFRRGQGWSAFVIAAGRATMKTVEIGHRNESEVEILGGMAEGEQVILHPPNQLNDGMRVRAE
ncbi:MAG TPA: efflux RND transporter periplasmic adaptor subunit [Candidatus Acidoferrales bacterium]|nr:efflux RND transporter periplasmic adaptor subunit [Candidatus Acidoferrales bacterium]